MTYIVFARWFGLVSIILSLGILFNLEDALEMAKRLIAYETGYIMGGVLPVIFGSLAIMFEHSLVPGWQLTLTLVSVAMLSAGIYRVLFVNHWKMVMSRYLEYIPFLFSLFGLMFGIVLLYIGFMANAFNFTLAYHEDLFNDGKNPIIFAHHHTEQPYQDNF